MAVTSASNHGHIARMCGPPSEGTASGSPAGLDAGCGFSGSAAKPGIVVLDGVGGGKLKGLFAAVFAGADVPCWARAGAADATRSRAVAAGAVAAGAGEAVVVVGCGGGGTIRTGVS